MTSKGARRGLEEQGTGIEGVEDGFRAISPAFLAKSRNDNARLFPVGRFRGVFPATCDGRFAPGHRTPFGDCRDATPDRTHACGSRTRHHGVVYPSPRPASTGMTGRARDACSRTR